MNEYLIYLAVMTLVTDLVIVCACIFPGRISGKAGYGWRKILWLILAVRLLMPIQTISSIAPVSVLPVRVPIEANSAVSSQSGVNTEKKPDTAQGAAAGTSGTGGAEQEGTLYRTDGTAGTGEAGRKDTAVRDSGSENRSSISRAWNVDGQFIFLFVWLTGAAGILGIRSVQYQILKKKVLEASVPCRDTGITAMICSICGEISVKDRIRVRISREIKTPMLFGYSKPIIVLPHRRYGRWKAVRDGGEYGSYFGRRCCARGRASSNDRIRDVSGRYRTGPDRRRCGVCEGRNAVHCISEK